jgi:hypothetical protein
LDSLRDGRETWAWKLGGRPVGEPVVDGETLYLGSANGEILAFDFDEIVRRAGEDAEDE